MPKKAQEEMVGFGLIIIIVTVILLVLLGFSLKNSQKEIGESYEVNSFIQAFLQYTSDCKDNLGYLSTRKLITNCYDQKKCLDGRKTCDVLNSTLKEIIEESWKVEGERPVKGYKLEIKSNEKEILLIEKGNITKNYKGSMQPLGKKNIDIFFTVYY